MGKKYALELENVSSYYGTDKAIHNADLKIPAGITQIIIGPSGAGKTTLLRLMNGIIEPKIGNVKFFGNKITKESLNEIRKNIGYIPQNLGLIKSYTVMENVLLGALSRTKTINSLFKKFSDNEIDLANHLIKLVGLEKKKEKQAFLLSGGEKRRVAIARAFMQKPKILLCDEILSDLDFYKVGQITNEIIKLKKEFDITIIMVEHDLKVAMAFGQMIAIIREGKIKGNYTREKLTNEFLYRQFT